MTYMEKKTNKRQMAIVSLSDYNQKQIDDMRQEQRNMTEEFEKQKDGEYYCKTQSAVPSVGISLKELRGHVEVFEILHRD